MTVSRLGTLAALALLPAACALPPRSGTEGGGTPGAVATVDPRATAAGLAALRAGGNAVDAAVTAALTLGVVDSHNSGIGGGCFLLARLADGTLLCLDGRETAPRAATRDMFLRDGEADPDLSRTGPLAVGVPGSLKAYEEALRRGGRRGLAAALAPGARLAREGAAVSPALAGRLREKAGDLALFPATRALFLDPGGGPWPEGHRLVQADLAETYDRIAAEGTGWFYGGPFAERVGAWMAAHGGVATREDFAGYRVLEREPLRTAWRGYEVVGFPPPSSGGVHVAQILLMLEGHDLPRMEREDPSGRLHLVAEAMKRAFADRAHWLGDPDFARVPRHLVNPGYCQARAADIDPERATPVAGPGTPPGASWDGFGRHTTHVAAADAEGNWVAITTTLNTSFGSKVVVPGTGVLLNNQMDDFSARPGVPNAYGLVGAEANAVAPCKRPLSSMSPTLVLRDGVPVLTLGAAGGPTIITQVVQVLVNHLDLGMGLREAVAAPRIHHQWLPDRVRFEAGLPPEVVEGLRRRGHGVEESETPLGATQAVLRRPDGSFEAVGDPRVPGDPAGRAGVTGR